MNARINKLKETKPSELLAHLYVDVEDTIRDKHIEDMWTHLYTGKPLDDIFRNNFCQYHGHLCRAPKLISVDVFDNVIQAKRWVSKHYGALFVHPFDPDRFEADPELAPMRFVACLHSTYTPAVDEHCYSPLELHAVLLTVVNVYRHMAAAHIEKLST